MNRCRRCGTIYDPDDRFCGFCGFNLAAQRTSELVTQVALKSKDILYDLGLAYFQNGQYKQAVATFEQILEGDPENLQIKEMCNRARKALME